MSRFIGKTLIILTVSGLLISLGFVLFIMTNGNKETVKLINNFNGETIYLIKKSWGFGDSKIAIGLNTRLRNGFNISQNDKYILTTGTDIIFYKLDSGKLYIYNDTFKKPTINKFHTEIVFIGLSNTEFYNLRENFNYKTKSLSVFPEIDKRLIK
jgi:hypothetical protein